MTSFELKLNPRFSAEFRDNVLAHFNDQPKTDLLDHVGVFTSGTTDSRLRKLVLLSKESLEASAMSFQSFFDLSKEDVYLNVLPDFHVGGRLIQERCALSGATMFRDNEVFLQQNLKRKWSPESFLNLINRSQSTVCSLVPTQIFDLVSRHLKCPKSLRLVLVGGAALDDRLFAKAQALGWPLRVTYGMTETAAMVAVAEEGSSKVFLPMPGVDVVVQDGSILIRSKSLLTKYVFFNSQGQCTGEQDPKNSEGFFASDDLGRRTGESGFEILGRKGDQIKVLGELVNLSDLNQRLQGLMQTLPNAESADAVILSVPHARNGNDLVILASGTSPETDEHMMTAFNNSAMPFERVSGVVRCLEIPRNELGKLDLSQARLLL